MSFDYGVYFRQNCIVPLLLLLFFAVLLIRVGYRLVLRLSKNFCLGALKENSLTLVLLAVLILFITISAVPLLRGGIYLLFEKESDAVEMSGVIERTVEIDGITGGKYGTENNNGRGEALIVNGAKYYLTTYGDLKVGDSVVMSVLPRSRFVLNIQKKDR